MGAVAKRSANTKDKSKNVNQTVTSKKRTEKQKPLNRKSLKSIKKKTTKTESKVNKNAHELVKKIQQKGKGKGKDVTAKLLNPTVANVLKNQRISNKGNQKKPVIQIKNKKKALKSRTNNQVQAKVINQKKKQVQTKNIQQNVTKNKKIEGPKEKSKAAKFAKVQIIQNKKQKKNVKQKIENGSEKLSAIKKQKTKQKKGDENISSAKSKSKTSDVEKTLKIPKLNIKRLEDMLISKQKTVKKEKTVQKPETLRDRMMAKLRASRFRFLNETLYNNDSIQSKKYFKDDPSAFEAYHNGYKQQVAQWPLNPLDVIISSIKKMPKDHIIADFGCGEARLASSVAQKVHSFDFVAMNDKVTACDMAHTPLLTNGAHVVVFCLSLMGTNLGDYLVEANRVLKKDGILKIAEVESRFDKVEDFINLLSQYGFTNTWKDLSHNLFYFLDFKKEKDITGKRNKLPPITLKPCLYKKR